MPCVSADLAEQSPTLKLSANNLHSVANFHLFLLYVAKGHFVFTFGARIKKLSLFGKREPSLREKGFVLRFLGL